MNHGAAGMAEVLRSTIVPLARRGARPYLAYAVALPHEVMSMRISLAPGTAKVAACWIGAAWLSTFLLAAPHASEAADLTVLNRARQPVSELYVSGTGDDSWGDDRLHGLHIAPGRAFRVALGRVRDCMLDLRVIYDDGLIEEKHGIDACRTRQYAFDGSTGVRSQAPDAAAADARHQVTVANDSPRSIGSIYLSDPSSDNWGEDRLGPNALPPGQRTQTNVVDCLSDIRIVFDNQSAEERRSVDVCRHPQLSIRPGWTTTNDLGNPADSPPSNDGANDSVATPHVSPPIDPAHRT